MNIVTKDAENHDDDKHAKDKTGDCKTSGPFEKSDCGEDKAQQPEYSTKIRNGANNNNLSKRRNDKTGKAHSILLLVSYKKELISGHILDD